MTRNTNRPLLEHIGIFFWAFPFKTIACIVLLIGCTGFLVLAIDHTWHRANVSEYAFQNLIPQQVISASIEYSEDSSKTPVAVILQATGDKKYTLGKYTPCFFKLVSAVEQHEQLHIWMGSYEFLPASFFDLYNMSRGTIYQIATYRREILPFKIRIQGFQEDVQLILFCFTTMVLGILACLTRLIWIGYSTLTNLYTLNSIYD